MSSAHDALYVRAVRDAEAELGPPPCPYVLLVLGSGARRESTLHTDQDHALALADDPPPGAGAWFAAMAKRLAATLEGCGLPLPPATSWPPTRPAEVTLRGLAGPVRPMDRAAEEEDALLEAAILFDFRQLHGDLDAEAPLRRVIRRAAGDRRFLDAWPRWRCAGGRRCGSCGTSTASAGSTSRRTASPRSSTSAGCSPWRRAARTSTVGRIRSAADHGTAGTAAPTWSPPSSTSRRSACATRPACWPPARGWTTASPRTRLTDAQRRWLKDALHLLRTCQDSVRIARTDLIG